jgi:2-polyprenyl-3-methyl-5-hydroxy-6-metoxy-1,4-benzoquinol methylase
MTDSVEGMAECNLCGSSMRVADALRWRKDGFDIVECARCGLLFRAQLPTEAEIPGIYGIGYFAQQKAGEDGGQGYADYLGDQDVHRLVARRRLRLLDRFGARGPLLDIGCAAGFFLDEAQGRGWAVEGVDVSESMADFARRELGLPVTTGLTGALDAGEGSYGAITMWDYIEHVLDPLVELRRAHSLLSRSDGLLALSTGDAAALVARLSGSRWHLLTPRHHTYFFTVTTLQLALERAGFQIVYAKHPGARYTLRYLAHKLRTMAPRSRVLTAADQRLGRSRLGRLSVPVNLGDIATVIARPRPGS